MPAELASHLPAIAINRAMTRIFVGALLLVAAGMAAVHRLDGLRLDGMGRATPAAMTATPAPSPTPVSSLPSARNVVLTKGHNGHFQVDARVDGRRVEFLVDTGASHIAIRRRDAARLGIYTHPGDFTVRVNTANGVTKAALVQLRTVEVGDILVRDVPAIVHADEGLSVNLLGMSFLSRVRWTHERGKLVLEQ
jgi:aspartyl protease family protein